jgi:hypothetical protein
MCRRKRKTTPADSLATSLQAGASSTARAWARRPEHVPGRPACSNATAARRRPARAGANGGAKRAGQMRTRPYSAGRCPRLSPFRQPLPGQRRTNDPQLRIRRLGFESLRVRKFHCLVSPSFVGGVRCHGGRRANAVANTAVWAIDAPATARANLSATAGDSSWITCA